MVGWCHRNIISTDYYNQRIKLLHTLDFYTISKRSSILPYYNISCSLVIFILFAYWSPPTLTKRALAAAFLVIFFPVAPSPSASSFFETPSCLAVKTNSI